MQNMRNCQSLTCFFLTSFFTQVLMVRAVLLDSFQACSTPLRGHDRNNRGNKRISQALQCLGHFIRSHQFLPLTTAILHSDRVFRPVGGVLGQHLLDHTIRVPRVLTGAVDLNSVAFLKDFHAFGGNISLQSLRRSLSTAFQPSQLKTGLPRLPLGPRHAPAALCRFGRTKARNEFVRLASLLTYISMPKNSVQSTQHNNATRHALCKSTGAAYNAMHPSSQPFSHQLL